MLQEWTILLAASAYLALLFAIAYYGDRRADAGRSVISNPWIYALSLAVYCTTWTFYGSVGRAAAGGVTFLPIYIGPTLIAPLWWVIVRKIIRISKANRITSIADFIGSRYGKSTLLAGLVTIVAVVGVIPYISLQLKAVSTSFHLLLGQEQSAALSHSDTILYITLFLAAFIILFGTRHLDATERHEGMVAAIAFESVVKLLAFLAVGIFVTFGLYDGFGDLFAQAARLERFAELRVLGDGQGGYGSWIWLTGLSMMAILFLPRQFQIAVVENVDENHLKKAIWLFPLYLLAINLFVLPIALGGLLRFPGGAVDADTFVLTLPLAEQQRALALFAFIGGVSAATGMVIVETIALSTMVCNDLVMPVLLRVRWLQLNQRTHLGGLLLGIRRGAIVVLLLLGYLYFRVASGNYDLVSIGLVSFAAVAQFAPAMLGGIFWKGAGRLGTLVGLSAGFCIWGYTLPLPSLSHAGWLPASFVEQGPFGLRWLRPYQLFGMTGLDEISHALFWSLLVNVLCYVGISLFSQQSAVEQRQAALFVDGARQARASSSDALWPGRASVEAVRSILRRFLGQERAGAALASYAREHGLVWQPDAKADAGLIHLAERLLAGAIGAASARIVVGSIVQEEPPGLDEVMSVLDETSQLMAYSQQLQHKSLELEAVTAELRAANERLQELDHLKDDFISTVTHELRTPLTSIRAFSEILYDHPDLDAQERGKFLGVIIKESERLTRLINQVLDLAKLESGNAEWHISSVDLRSLVEESLLATSQLFEERGVRLEAELAERVPPILGDQDRLIQVMLNLLSNAAKFCAQPDGLVVVRLVAEAQALRVEVSDNGPGIQPEQQRVIFDKFRQLGHGGASKPQGTGLGLPISRELIAHLGGELWVQSRPGHGATFAFRLPLG